MYMQECLHVWSSENKPPEKVALIKCCPYPATPCCCGTEHFNSDNIHPRVGDGTQKCAIFLLSLLLKLCPISELEHDSEFFLNGSSKMSKRTFTSSQMIPGTKSNSVSNRKCARKDIYQRSDSAVANNNPPAHWTSSSLQALEASSSFRRFTMRKKKLSSTASAVRKDRLGRRGTSWGRLSQPGEAAWGNGGGRGRNELRIAKKRERNRGLSLSSTPLKRRPWDPPR